MTAGWAQPGANCSTDGRGLGISWGVGEAPLQSSLPMASTLETLFLKLLFDDAQTVGMTHLAVH